MLVPFPEHTPRSPNNLSLSCSVWRPCERLPSKCGQVPSPGPPVQTLCFCEQSSDNPFPLGLHCPQVFCWAAFVPSPGPLGSICYCWWLLLRRLTLLLFWQHSPRSLSTSPTTASPLVLLSPGSFHSLYTLPKTPPSFMVSTVTTFRPWSIGFLPPDGKKLLTAF